MAFPAPDITLRSVKGSPLSWPEADANISGLRDFCEVVGQLFMPDGSIDPSLLQSVLSNFLITGFIGQTSGYLPPVGKPLWMPKALDPAALLPANGASYVRADGAKLLQADYPKLFAYLGHDFDADGNLQSATIHASALNHVATVAVHSAGGGSGYVANDILTIAAGTGTAATVKVNTVSSGAITSISVLTRGNYSVSPATPNSATGGTGSGANLDLTFVTDGGGTGYAVDDVLTIVGGTGSPATVKVTSVTTAGGGIATVDVVSAGNYSASPTTPNTPSTTGDGTGAVLDLTLSSSVNTATEFRVPVLDGSFLFGADGDFPLGSAGGEKYHALGSGENAPHVHVLHKKLVAHGAADTAVFAPTTGDSQADGATLSAGGGVPHNNMPPFRSGLYYLIAGYRVNSEWV
jgi:hypothetical protein